MIEQKIKIRNQEINLLFAGEKGLPTIVFLHGFTGSTRTWQPIMTRLQDKFHVVAIDLTGHGKTDVPNEVERYTMAEQLNDLNDIFEALDLTTFTLVGYSMGGRIALAYTMEYPKKVQKLLLESASPGLKTAEERRERKEADERLANKIINEGIRQFIDFWEEIPLFKSQKSMPVDDRKAVRAERLAQDEQGLANSLLGIGTGSQPSYWPRLQEVTIPVLLITGELDQKFVGIAEAMNKQFISAQSKVIKDVGHAIHVENPSLFATIVEEYVLS